MRRNRENWRDALSSESPGQGLFRRDVAGHLEGSKRPPEPCALRGHREAVPVPAARRKTRGARPALGNPTSTETSTGRVEAGRYPPAQGSTVRLRQAWSKPVSRDWAVPGNTPRIGVQVPPRPPSLTCDFARNLTFTADLVPAPCNHFATRFRRVRRRARSSSLRSQVMSTVTNGPVISVSFPVVSHHGTGCPGRARGPPGASRARRR